MMKSRSIFAAAFMLTLTILLAAGSTAVASGKSKCKGEPRLRLGETANLEGRLITASATHDAQGQFTYYVLVLGRKVCVDPPLTGEMLTPDSIDKAQDRLQLAFKDHQQKQAAAHVGKRIRVSGNLFEAHTQWHKTDALVDVAIVTVAK